MEFTTEVFKFVNSFREPFFEILHTFFIETSTSFYTFQLWHFRNDFTIWYFIMFENSVENKKFNKKKIWAGNSNFEIFSNSNELIFLTLFQVANELNFVWMFAENS